MTISASTASDVTMSLDPEIDALLGGTKWGGSTGSGAAITYSFPWTSGSAIFSGPWGNSYSDVNEPSATYHFGLDPNQQSAVRAALQAWANVADLDFTAVADSAYGVGDIRVAWTSASNGMGDGSEPWGWAYSPSSDWPSGGDVWISALNDETATDSWLPGSYNYNAMLHELGHALGLKHPFDAPSVLPPSLDSRLYTLMSYTDGPNSIYPSAGYVNGVYQWLSYNITPQTPMVLDIAAIQYLYGANWRYRTGNDTYTFDTGTPFFETLWDAGGTDTLSASNFSLSCVLDLAPGHYSSLRIPPPQDTGGAIPTYDGTDNLGIAFGCIIENAIGGSGDDTLIGNYSDNQLSGGGGYDTVVLSGRYADYTIAYNTATAHFTVTDSIAGRDGRDDISAVESFRFSDGTKTATELIATFTPLPGLTVNGTEASDHLTGGARADTINAGSGDDIVTGLGGDDNIDGGAGRDTATFATSRTGYVIAKTANGYVVRDQSGADGTDTLSNVEVVQFADKAVALAQLDRLSEYFIAYYGRPGAWSGIDYWLDGLAGALHGDEDQLVWNFGNAKQPEFAALYGGTSSMENFVANVFDNLFNRTPTAGGVEYWTGIFDQFKAQGLDDDAIRGKMVTWIMDGAQDANGQLDRTTLDNKMLAASAFTAAIDTTDELAGYRNPDNTTALAYARGWLHEVTSEPGSLMSHIDVAAVDEAVAELVGLYITQ